MQDNKNRSNTQTYPDDISDYQRKKKNSHRKKKRDKTCYPQRNDDQTDTREMPEMMK